MPGGVGSGAFANAGAGIQQAGIGNQMSGFYKGRANNVFHSLFPTLQGEMTNPQGFGKDLGAINTANQQSIGGSVAGAVGQGNLQAARTGNAGGFAPALDESARAGARQMSQNAVGVQEANSYLKQQQRDAATRALSGLYGENTDATLKALGLANEGLGLSNDSLKTALGADQLSQNAWLQPLVAGMQGASKVAAAGMGGN